MAFSVRGEVKIVSPIMSHVEVFSLGELFLSLLDI